MGEFRKDIKMSHDKVMDISRENEQLKTEVFALRTSLPNRFDYHKCFYGSLETLKGWFAKLPAKSTAETRYTMCNKAPY